MNNFFQAIKKRRHKRRLSVLWMFLIVMELFCPVLCSEQVQAAELTSLKTPVTVEVQAVPNTPDSIQFSASNADSQNHHHTGCDDDCFCQGMGILNIPFSIQKHPVLRDGGIAYHFDEPVLNSLSPPDLPPKIS